MDGALFIVQGFDTLVSTRINLNVMESILSIHLLVGNAQYNPELVLKRKGYRGQKIWTLHYNEHYIINEFWIVQRNIFYALRESLYLHICDAFFYSSGVPKLIRRRSPASDSASAKLAAPDLNRSLGSTNLYRFFPSPEWCFFIAIDAWTIKGAKKIF